MLCDGDADVHRIGVNKILAMRAAHHTSKTGSFREQIPEDVASHISTDCKFLLPTLNVEGRYYCKFTDLNDSALT